MRLRFLHILAALFTGICPVMPASPTNLLEVVRRYAEAWIRHDPDAAAALMAPDYRLYALGAPELVRGPEGYKRQTASYLAAFPDLTAALENLIAEGGVTPETLARWINWFTDSGNA